VPLPSLVAVPALLPDWLNPMVLLERYGTAAFLLVLLIVFAECGIFLGFFLPGDSLLFATGLFIANGTIQVNIVLACVLISLAAILGNLVGYWIGYVVGPPLFDRPDSRLFKREHVARAHAFFERYGAPAIILARFVPIVRTFITAIAGIAKMDFRTYMTYSAIGGVLWGTIVTLAGYWLGNVPFVRDHIELILVAIVLVSVVPIAIEWWRHRNDPPLVPDTAAAEA
jgi:membrane-associated protein